jgi:putative spermidine/putrescine transport system ATP-binding protein
MQVELRRLLKTIGATAVFVTHDQDEALTMSDKVAVMSGGRIEQFGEPISVYARPRSLFAMRFVGISSELRGNVAARRGTRLRVDTRHGPIFAEGDEPVGASVIVATRPEHVELDAVDGADHNHVAGCVRQITFQGSRTRVAVDVGADSDFIVETGRVNELPAQGEPVVLRWPVDRTFAFPDAGKAA